MLLLSDFVITFKPSNDYLKLALLIHLFTIIVLLKSAFPVLLIMLTLFLLLVCLIRIIRAPMPLPAYSRLAYQAGYWVLRANSGRSHKFERVTVRFDGGLFILLTLTGYGPSKNLVIFNDQMTNKQHRILRVVGKITQKV